MFRWVKILKFVNRHAFIFDWGFSTFCCSMCCGERVSMSCSHQDLWSCLPASLKYLCTCMTPVFLQWVLTNPESVEKKHDFQNPLVEMGRLSHFHRPSGGPSCDIASHFTIGMRGPTWFVEMADEQALCTKEHTRDFLLNIENVYSLHLKSLNLAPRIQLNSFQTNMSLINVKQTNIEGRLGPEFESRVPRS